MPNFQLLIFKKYAWSCQVYHNDSRATLEIIQKQLLRSSPLDKIIGAQLGLKVSRTFNPLPITLFKGLKGSYRLEVKNDLLKYFLAL